MERLPEQQQAKIAKMGDERLKTKLQQAGYNAEIVSTWSRQELIGTWAQIVADELGQAAAQAAEHAVAEDVDEGEEEVEQLDTADVETERRLSLEERHLMLEERRLEEQRLQREQDERRWMKELELKERELELKRVTANHENAQKQREHELKCKTAEQENEQRNNIAMKLKLWGEALRNAISKMPDEPIEVISWFISLERLFVQLSVPAELKVVLMRPYFNDRAKTLFARCDEKQAADYDAVKRYLLQEMRLSPSVYLEKFNSVTRENSETYNQFATRLMSLLDFYIESRNIKGDYKRLVELLAYDKIKANLPQYLAKHVLALESSNPDGWIGRAALTEAVDAFMAGSLSDGRARLPGPSNANSRPGQNVNTGGNLPITTGVRTDNHPEVSRPRQFTPGVTPRIKRCYLCNSPNHLQINCPRRGGVGNTSFRPGNGGFRGNRSGQAVSVNAASSRPVPSHVVTQAVQTPVAGAAWRANQFDGGLVKPPLCRC